MRNLFLSILIVSLFSCSNNDCEPILIYYNDIWTEDCLDNAESWNNSLESSWECILNELLYPAEARENGIEGLVEIELTISQLGNLSETKLITDIGGNCGQAALEALENCHVQPFTEMPLYNNEKVSVQYILPIRFRLE